MNQTGHGRVSTGVRIVIEANRASRMPKKANVVKKAAATKKNAAAASGALSSESAIVGCVTKALGNGAFRVQLKGGKELTGLIRGLLKGGRNSAAYVQVGSWVILEENSNRTLNQDEDEETRCSGSQMMQEILGVVTDRKVFKKLIAAGHIELTEDDKEEGEGGFIFDRDEVSDDEDGKKVRAAEDEVDIDAI